MYKPIPMGTGLFDADPSHHRSISTQTRFNAKPIKSATFQL